MKSAAVVARTRDASTWWALVRGFLLDYARNSTNVLVLVLVPVVFVLVAADALADAARLLGGNGAALAQATAGWAAGFLSAVAMYFQVAAARDTDRRLQLCGASPATVVGARLCTGIVLALTATATALMVLAAREPLTDPVRVVVGTSLFALVYVGVGAAVGGLVRDPVNGTVVVLFIWIIDVFFGPTLSSSSSALTRLFPTHFVSLWIADTPSGHSGWVGDLGVSLAWVVAALAGSAWLIARTGAVERTPTSPRRRVGSRPDQYLRATRLGFRELGRNPTLWAMLAVVPAVFIVLSDVITPHGHTAIEVRENAVTVARMFDPAVIHAGTMAPIAVASLAMLVGLFTVVGGDQADRRLCLSGMRPATLFAVRMTTIGVAALVACVVSLAAAAAVFDPANWAVYAAGNVLLALTYALLGVAVGRVFGRVSGVFLAFLIPFLDVGIAQSPMLSPRPDAWAHWLPAYGGTRLVVDGGLTATFDQGMALLYAVAWLAGLVALGLTIWLRTPSAPTLPTADGSTDSTETRVVHRHAPSRW